MPLQTTGTTQTGTTDEDYLLGDGTTSTQNGGDANDLIIGRYG